MLVAFPLLCYIRPLRRSQVCDTLIQSPPSSPSLSTDARFMNMFLRCGAALALIALYGLPISGQPTTDAPPTPTSAKRGFIKLLVPADAKVEIDGVATKQTGTTRLFATPELDPAKDGKQYFYRVKVTNMVDGKPVVIEKEVYIELGREVAVDVMKPDPKKEEPKKEEPKKEEPKKEEPKKEMKKEEPKKEEPKKEEPKKEEPKKEEPKKEEPKKEMKKEEPKKEEPKKEEPKKEEPKKEIKKEEPKKEEPKKEMKKEEPKKPEEKKPEVKPPVDPKKLEEPKPVTPKVLPVIPLDPKKAGIEGERLTVPPRIVKE